ncbi:hypothetical protein EMIHUDRAFT_125586, partial [Emiliania huxleyi CCMP1516]|uniref:Uncharacterized protein n=2 Tax=Emiliania huxleyi TaxID=2903 RepID=A0A0D3KWE0_EMIH1
MEAHEEREGRDPAALSRSPLAELWEEGEEGEEGDSDSDAEQPTALAEHTGGGGERGLASEWWAGAREARLRPMAPPLPSAEPRALDLGCVSPQAELQAWRAAARRAAALAANVAADERAAAAAAMRREEEEREASRRRKEVEAKIGAEAVRAAAAAAARANPLPPKPIEQPEAATTGATGATGADSVGATPAAGRGGAPVSLAQCGYWFEDAGESVK